jgi:hypothetical protein
MSAYKNFKRFVYIAIIIHVVILIARLIVGAFAKNQSSTNALLRDWGVYPLSNMVESLIIAKICLVSLLGFRRFLCTCCCSYAKFLAFYLTLDFALGISIGVLLWKDIQVYKYEVWHTDLIFEYAMAGMVAIEGIAIFVFLNRKHNESSQAVSTELGFVNNNQPSPLAQRPPDQPTPVPRPPAVLITNSIASRPQREHQPIAMVSELEKRVIVEQTPNGISITGIEEQHAIIEDGQGGILVFIKTTANALSAGVGDVSLRELEDTKIFHITREAILRNPQNPDIRVINSTELSTINISPEGRTQLRALRQ